MNRRNFVIKSAVAAGALALPDMMKLALAQSGPIKIGFMTPLTGVAASPGREMLDGWNLFWQQYGNKIAGRPVEIFVEDDASNPDTALQKARRLVQQQGVTMLAGNILANTGLAVAEFAKTSGVPYLLPAVAADDLTQRNRIPNVIRAGGFSASQLTRPLADWALKQGYKRVVTIGQDYTFGHEQAGGFIQVFTEGGGKLAGQLWHPLNTADLSPYLGQIEAMKPDIVFAVETGADANRLLQQWNSFGMRGKFQLLGSQNLVDQSVIRNLQPAECEGVVSSSHYSEGRDDPTTKKFVESYEAAYKKIPGIFAAEGFTGALWLTEALERLSGKAEDTKAFLRAMASETVESSPLGKNMKLDAYGNPIFDVYIRRVVRRGDGKLLNNVIATYPQVSQFWKYKPEEYMKLPKFSREFQGVKK